MFTTGLLPRRQLLHRRILADIAAQQEGLFLLVSGPKGVNKEQFTREIATSLADFQVLTQRALKGFQEPTSPTVIIADAVHLASPEDLDRVVGCIHDPGAPRLIILGTAPHRIDAATDVVPLPPLTVAETAQLTRQVVGACTPVTAHRLHDATGGFPQLIRELLDSAPMDNWSAPRPAIVIPKSWGHGVCPNDLLRLVASFPFMDGMPVEDQSPDLDAAVEDTTLSFADGRVRFNRPEVRSVIRASTPPSMANKFKHNMNTQEWETSEAGVEKLSQQANLPLARLHVQHIPHDQALSQRGYLALYGGQAHVAPPVEPSLVTAAHHLAAWDPAGLRAFEHSGNGSPADRATMAMMADAIESGIRPAPSLLPQPQTAREHQIRDLITGWLALVYDDPASAQQLLSRRQPGDSDLVGLWQSAFLARTHYVLGEFSQAASVVEQGLANGDRAGAPLLEPVLLWTGAQVAALSGRAQLSNHYLSRMTVPGDAFIIQKLPAAMGRMITASMTSDTRTAAMAGDRLAKIVYTTDTQQPGFWPWQDMYALSLIRSGRVDTAATVMEAIHARQQDSGIVSLHARNLVPQAIIEIQRGATARGVKMLSEAVDAITSVNMPAYEARILFEFGLVLRRMGRRSQAAEIFTRAEDVFNAMGAVTLAARCAAERRVSGIGGSRRSAQGLTPQEEQITALVVDGASNQEVARELSLSTKTVEYHLTRVYKKFKVSSRGELRSYLQ